MKTIKNILGIILALAAMTAFYACDDEPEYTPAEVPAGAQAYFPSTVASKIELKEAENSFSLPLKRVKTSDAASITISATAPAAFTVPSSVSFASGADETALVISYDPEQLEYDDFQKITVTLSDQSTTSPYGITEYSFTAGVPAPWQTLGRGSYYDGFNEVEAVFTTGTSGVEIQQHMLEPTRYRFTSIYKNEDVPYLEFKVLPAGSVHKGVTTTINGLIVYDDMKMAYNSNYGEHEYGMHPSRFTSMATEAAWSFNRVTKFSAEGKPEVVEFAPYFYLFGAGGGWNYTKEPILKLVFPGVVLSDYSIGVAYTGTYTGPDGSVEGVVAQITAVGEDVTSVRFAVAPGTNIALTVEEIKNGNINFIEAPAEKGYKVLIPFNEEPEEGLYTIAAVSYDGKKWEEFTSTTFKYTPPFAEAWTAHSVGDFEYTLVFGSKAKPAVDKGLTLYQSDYNPNRWKIGSWGAGVDFTFTYDPKTGKVLVDEQETGAVDPDYGMVFVNDIVSFTGGTEYGESSYKDGVFTFGLVYYDADGVWANGAETFTVTGKPEVKKDLRATSSFEKMYSIYPTTKLPKKALMQVRNDLIWE
ncbi:hypothetical protein LJC38_01260 [Parabacteroides sp. OttesenSCG-928-K15]|nr:hypothetical protein [Parabacteroides sp. OttesenSCG-928-K15]